MPDEKDPKGRGRDVLEQLTTIGGSPPPDPLPPVLPFHCFRQNFLPHL